MSDDKNVQPSSLSLVGNAHDEGRVRSSVKVLEGFRDLLRRGHCGMLDPPAAAQHFDSLVNGYS